MTTPTEFDVTALTGKADRNLLVAALQALHRERVTAWNSATTVAILRGTTAPPREMFGMDEVADMLRRFGAAPSSF